MQRSLLTASTTMRRQTFRPAQYVCDFPHCNKRCITEHGLRRHQESVHIIPVDLLPRDVPISPPAQDSNAADFEHRTPSPTFSSRRSPRRTPRGSPIRRNFTQNSNPVHHGVDVDTHPILDGTSSNFAYAFFVPNITY